MPKTETKYAFVEYFTLNDGRTVSLSYGKVGGDVRDKPYSLEDAVIEYTVSILSGKLEQVKTIKDYNDIGAAISQYALLEKTVFSSVLDHRLDGVRSLLGEVRRRTA